MSSFRHGYGAKVNPSTAFYKAASLHVILRFTHVQALGRLLGGAFRRIRFIPAPAVPWPLGIGSETYPVILVLRGRVAFFARPCNTHPPAGGRLPIQIKKARLRRARGDLYRYREPLAHSLVVGDSGEAVRRKIPLFGAEVMAAASNSPALGNRVGGAWAIRAGSIC